MFCDLSSTVIRPNSVKLRLTRSLCFIPIQPNAKTSIYQSWTSGFTGERSHTAYSAVSANFKIRFDLQVINSVRGGWKIAVKFSKPSAEIFNINKARFASRSQDRRTFYIENVPGQIQNANFKQCERINVEFAGKLVSSPANKTLSTFVMFERKEPEYSEINPPGTCPTVPHLE